MKHLPKLPTRQVGLFLKGPIPFAILRAVHRCGGKCLPVFLALRHKADLSKNNEADVSLAGIAKVWDGELKPAPIRRAISLLENGGLIKVHRPPGRKLRVQLLVPDAAGAQPVDSCAGLARGIDDTFPTTSDSSTELRTPGTAG